MVRRRRHNHLAVGWRGDRRRRPPGPDLGPFGPHLGLGGPGRRHRRTEERLVRGVAETEARALQRGDGSFTSPIWLGRAVGQCCSHKLRSFRRRRPPSAVEMSSTPDPDTPPRVEERRIAYSKESLLSVREACRDKLPAGIHACKREVEAASLMWDSEPRGGSEPPRTRAGCKSKKIDKICTRFFRLAFRKHIFLKKRMSWR
ncbi:uncharacterized protein [Triticum aestivum]|uniref:uncharacterized protein n=1 Tax=Triticum aestivum TaxID=4565 RepID=UPI001D01B52F|nr:uncharacterized protein LOC123139128 [Triticum aestivum]